MWWEGWNDIFQPHDIKIARDQVLLVQECQVIRELNQGVQSHGPTNKVSLAILPGGVQIGRGERTISIME